MIHAFDIDGVVTDQSALIHCLQKEIPQATLDHIRTYHVPTAMIQAGFIKDLSWFNDAYFFGKYGEEIYANAQETKGFKKYYQKLISLGHEVHFITARPLQAEYLTKKLFKNIGIPYENVHHVGNPQAKVSVLAALRPDFFYEDNLETLIQFRYLYKQGVVVDYPYNRGGNLAEYNLKRIKDFTNVRNIRLNFPN